MKKVAVNLIFTQIFIVKKRDFFNHAFVPSFFINY